MDTSISSRYADVGLVYDKSSNTGDSVTGYVDSDYAGDINKRRSLTGYIFTLSGSAISWKATLHLLLYYQLQKPNIWHQQKR